MSGFTLRKPKIMSQQSVTDRIDKAWLLNVSGQVASVSGDCIEVRGMTAPVGSPRLPPAAISIRTGALASPRPVSIIPPRRCLAVGCSSRGGRRTDTP